MIGRVMTFITVLILGYASTIIFSNGIAPIWRIASDQGAFTANSTFGTYVPDLVSFSFYGTAGFIIFLIALWVIGGVLADIGRGLVSQR